MRAVVLVWCIVLAACGAGSEFRAAAPSSSEEFALTIPSDRLWGGELRCRADGCWLFAVEHEANRAVLHRIAQRAIASSLYAPVAYHPDGARWIDDRYAVAAVEESRSLDVFDTTLPVLRRVAQGRLPFPPRNVMVWPAREGGWWLLALPYAGRHVAWLRWDPAMGMVGDPIVQTWCNEPWYVEAWHGSTPPLPQPGLLVACNADQTVGYVPLGADLSRRDVEAVAWQPLRTFPYRSRQARLTPSQRYLYVTQDLGGQVARMDTRTGVWVDVSHPVQRVNSVAPLDEHRVAWGAAGAIHLIRYDDDGGVVAHRSIPFDGFVETLYWYDIDGDARNDLLALDLTGTSSRILYDAIWP